MMNQGRISTPTTTTSGIQLHDTTITTILLVQHAETIDNVRHNYAGTTNSPLTNHGVLQAQALAAALAKHPKFSITHLATSPLQRAFQTAIAIQKAATTADVDLTVSLHSELVERDFGSLEGKSYQDALPKPKRLKITPFLKRDTLSSSLSPSMTLPTPQAMYEFNGVESHESLVMRANSFIDSYILPILARSERVATVAIVSHGILLGTLFRELTARFRKITISPEAAESGFFIGRSPRWDNASYTTLQLHPASTVSPQSISTQSVTLSKKQFDHNVVVMELNVTRHLKGFKRTGGGIGSAQADPKQRSMKDFFKATTTGTQTQGTARVKHASEEDPCILPPPPPPSSSQHSSRFSSIIPPSSSFRTDASSEFFPSSPPPQEGAENDANIGMYHVSDFF